MKHPDNTCGAPKIPSDVARTIRTSISRSRSEGGQTMEHQQAHSANDIKPIYVRVSDCKKVFGLSRSTIYVMVSRGIIRIHKYGSASLLKVSEIEAAIEGANNSANDDGGLAGGLRRTG